MLVVVMAVIVTTFGCSFFFLSFVYRRLRSEQESSVCRVDGGLPVYLESESVFVGSNNNNNNSDNDSNIDEVGIDLVESVSKYNDEENKDGDGRKNIKEARDETKTKRGRYENEKGNEEELWEVRRVSIFIVYLERTYWAKHAPHASFHSEEDEYEATREDLKPVLRISKSKRKIHIVYSKNTLWNLAFCDNLQSNKNEQFALIFKGLKSWSIDETRGRFSDVMQDLFEFRAEIRQELTNRRTALLGKLPACCKTVNEMNDVVSATGKINEPKSIVPFYGNPLGHDVVCQSAQLHMLDDKPHDWKVDPPEGLELLIPSVCFVIPSKDTAVPGHACGIEVQYKHLLTAWNNQVWETKQAVTSSEIMSVLKIYKPASDEHKLLEDLVDGHTEQLTENENDVDPDVEPDESDIESDVISDIVIIPLENDVVEGEMTVSQSDQEEIGVYEALLLGSDVVSTRDASGMASRDFIIEEDIYIASVKELLYRLDNILKMLNSNETKIDEDQHLIKAELQMINDLQNEVDEELYPQYKQVTMATSHVTSSDVKHNVDLLIKRWNVVVFALRERGHTLIGAGVDSRVTRDLHVFLCSVEETLISQLGITAVPGDLEKQYVQLVTLQNGFASFDSRLKKLTESVEHIQSAHRDYAYRIVARWERCYIQVQARREQLETLKQRVAKFRAGLLSQTEWLEKVYEKLKSDEVVLFEWVEHASKQSEGISQNSRMQRLLKEYVGITRKLTRQRRGIQKTFYGAEEFILASKMYENDLKEYYYSVHGCEDHTCRYDVDRSRDWVANTTLKLSQLYEAVINEVLTRTNMLLTNSSFGASSDGDNSPESVDYEGDNSPESVDYDGDNSPESVDYDDGDSDTGGQSDYYDDRDTTIDWKSHDYDGDNSTETKSDDYDSGDSSYYWENEFEGVMKWMEVKEVDLANEMPSYKSMDELSAYVGKLQDIRSDIVSNDQKVTSTLEALYDTLRQYPTRSSDVVREDVRAKVVPLELRWSKLQWESEGRNARVITLHDVSHNYDKVGQPFLKWLRKAEIQSETLNLQWASLDADTHLTPSAAVDASDVNASHLEHLQILRMRHGKFLRDVTHHEEDLQKVNRYGKTLISLVKEFQWYITDFPDSLSTGVNGTSQIWDLERSLYEINERYRRLLHSLALSTKSRDLLVEKHKDYVGMVEAYITWVSETEIKISAEMQETTNFTHKRLSRKIDDVARIRRDIHKHSSGLVVIQMASDVLSTLHNYGKKHDRTLNVDEIMTSAQNYCAENSTVMWVTVTNSIRDRYDKLCDVIMSHESRLQTLYVNKCDIYQSVEILLKRVISAQQSVVELGVISSDTQTLIEQVKKLRSITSELEVIKDSLEVVSTNVEEHDWTKNQFVHEQTPFERLRSVRTLFNDLQLDVSQRSEECIASCVSNMTTFRTWLSTVLRDLQPDNLLLSTDITSVEENITNITKDMEIYTQVFQILNQCGRELTSLRMREHDDNRVSDLSLVINDLNNKWRAVAVELMKRRNHVNEVLTHSNVYNETFQSLFRWLERMEEYVKRFSPASLNAHVLGAQVREQKALLNDAYGYNGTVEVYTDMAESSLYDIYSRYSSDRGNEANPENRVRGNEPSPIELEKIKSIRDRFEDIVSVFECRGVNLKAILTQLEEYNNAYRELTAWLQCSAHAQMTCRPIESTLDETVKHFETCEVYERDLNRMTSQVEHMLKLGWKLVQNKQGRIDDVTTIKLENEKIKVRWEVIKKASWKNIDLFICALEKCFMEEHQKIICTLKTKHEEVISIDTGIDIETYVGELSDILSEYEKQLSVFYQAAGILTKRYIGKETDVSRLVDEVDEAWKKLHRLIKNSNVIKNSNCSDTLCLKDADEIRNAIRHKEEISDEFENVSIQKAEGTAMLPYVDEITTCRIPHFLIHTSIPLITRGHNTSTCLDDKRRLGNRVQLGCHKINSLENYTYLKSTVERHTRVGWSHMCNKPLCRGRINTYTDDACLSADEAISDDVTGSQIFGAGETAIPENETVLSQCAGEGAGLMSEVVLRTPDQKNVSKITTTNVRRVEKLTLRRKYTNDMGEECIEEKEIPESEKEKYMKDEKEYLDAGAVIIKSPDENQSTTTEEEFVRDGDGNVTEWIVRKRTRLTKRTRIIRKSVINEQRRNSLDTHDHGEHISATSCHVTPNAIKEIKELRNLRNDKENNTKGRRVVRRPVPPSFVHKLPPKPMKMQESKVSTTLCLNPHTVEQIIVERTNETLKCETTSAEDNNEERSHSIVDTSHISHVPRSSHTSHISIPSLTSDNNSDHIVGQHFTKFNIPPFTSDNNSNHIVDQHFTELKLKCIKRSLKDTDDHVCPEHVFEEIKEPEADIYLDMQEEMEEEEGCLKNTIEHTLTEHIRNDSDHRQQTDKRIPNESDHRQQTDKRIPNEEDHRQETDICNYEREVRDRNNDIDVYNRLDTDDACALVEHYSVSNDTDIHSFHGDEDIFTDNWVPIRRRKRVKVMIIVSDKSNDVFEDNDCRTTCRISPRNALYLGNIPSPMQPSPTIAYSSDTPLLGTSNTDNEIPQSEPQSESHSQVQGEGETEGKSLRTKSRKKSLVKITVGEHSNRDVSPSSSSPRQAGGVLIRERHNSVRTTDVVPSSEKVDATCDDEWKPAMRILTRNASKIIVTHSNRCSVTGDAILDESDHCEGDASSSFDEKKSVVSVTLTSKS